MTPAVFAALAVAAAALIVALIGLVVVARRRERAPEPAAIIQQIDSVRAELRDLSELFLVPRRRGVVGESILSELLASWLPPGAYELQHGFANGTRVDAVIRLGSRLVPVDSKFPLEAVARWFGEQERTADAALPGEVRKAFRTHVAAIAERYIRPAEGTMSFALMYVPSERVYVELFAGRSELMQLALEASVVPVSPATLFLYLQTVAYGLRGLALPESTRRLLDDLEALRTDLAAFTKSFDLAGGHLRNLSRAFDEAGSRLGRVDARVERLADGSAAGGSAAGGRKS